MKVYANANQVPAQQDPPRPTYGDCIGKVISSNDLSQSSKSVYFIVESPFNPAEVLMVPLEYRGPVSRITKATPLGSGYVVRENATLILNGV